MSAAFNKIADDLRIRAEALIAQSPNMVKHADLKSINKLAHELAVHQAELELQNEELLDTQSALQATKDRFAALFEHAPAGYVVLDDSGIIRQANKTWCVMMNSPDEDFRGRPFADTIFSEDASIFLARFRSFFRNPLEKQIVVRMKKKGSAPFHAQIEAAARNIKPCKDADTGDELMIIVSDITDLQEARLDIENKNIEIEQANERLGHINRVLLAIRNVNQLIVQESDPSRLIERACINLTETMGYFSAWIVLLDDNDTVSVKTAASGFDGGFEAMRKHISEGSFPSCMRRALDLNETIVIENPILHCPDCPLSSDYEGRTGLVRRLSFGEKTYGVLAVSVPENYAHSEEDQDLFTEVAGDLAFALHKIEMEKRLAESQGRYIQIFERSRDGFVMVDKTGRVIDANQAYCDMLGYSLEELRALSDFYLITPERWHDWEAEEIWRKRLLGQGYSGLYEKEYIRKDGSVFPVELRSYALRKDNGEIDYLWGTARDITERKRAEDTILRKNAMLARTEQVAHVGSWEWEVDGDRVSWSDELFRIFGLEPADEAPSFTDHQSIYVPEDRQRLLDAVAECVKTGKAYELEMRAVRPDGEIRYCVVRGLGERGPEGSIHRLWGSLQDITERKQFEMELRESEEKFRNIFSEISDAVFIHDMEGRFLEVNDVACRRLGYSRDELLTMSPMDIDVPEFVRQVPKRLQTMDIEKQLFFETAHRRKDGSDFPVEIHSRTIQYGGKPCVLSVARDVTERIKAEKAIRESERYLRSIIQTSADGFWTLDSAGIIVEVNDAYCRMSGYAREEIIGLSINDLDARESPAETAARIGRIINKGSELFETLHRRKDGGVWPAEISVSWLDEQGGRFVCFCRDLTERKQREERIALLGRMLDDAPAAITIHNTDGRFLYANAQTVSLHGYQDEKEFLDVSLHELDVPESEALLAERFRRIAETGEARFEVAHHRKDGTTFPLEVLAKAIEWQGQHAVLSIATDITERKLADEALRESESRFRKLIDSAPMSILLVQEGKYFFGNPASAQLMGYNSFDEISGMEALETIAPEMRELVLERIKTINGGKDNPPLEMKLIKRNGDTVWSISSSVAITMDGKPTALIVGQDITDLKRTEEALMTERNNLQAAFASSPIGMLVFDENEQVIFANPAARRMFHSEFLENSKYRCGDFILCVNRENDARGCGFSEACAQCSLLASLRTVLKKETTADHVDGEELITTSKVNLRKIWVRFKCSPMTLNGHPCAIISLDDISERKQVEEEKEKLQNQLQQAQKMEAVGTLAGGISHDFNNLLQAVNGYTQLLLMDKTEEDPEYHSLKAIRDAGFRASDLVRQLLLFSRKADSTQKPLELQHEIEHAKQILERTIPKMVEITVSAGNRLWTINADPVQIEQMLLNFGINAADAMPDGGKLLFEVQNTILIDDYPNNQAGAPPGRYVLLIVSDTGEGMDKETLNHIFDPFFTTKEFGKGTGLGLASVYGIVKSHGGFITCSSEVGQGTTFKIYFPAIIQPEVEEIGEIEAGPLPRGTETVLIVDDEKPIRDFAEQALAKFGYTVVTASTGEEALEHYAKKANEIDLIVMDLGMPGMGGRKCLQELLRIDPSVKVVIASGYAINGQVRQSIEAGARGYIGKPYQLEDLVTTVRTVLDERR